MGNIYPVTMKINRIYVIIFEKRLKYVNKNPKQHKKNKGKEFMKSNKRVLLHE